MEAVEEPKAEETVEAAEEPEVEETVETAEEIPEEPAQEEEVPVQNEEPAPVHPDPDAFQRRLDQRYDELKWLYCELLPRRHGRL